MSAMKSRQELQSDLIERATKDASFRAALLSDSKAVLERELGMSMPEGWTIKVVEETPQTVYLVLPRAEDSGPAEAELSTEDLQKVAGGWSHWSDSAKCW